MSTDAENPAPRRGRPRKNHASAEQAASKDSQKSVAPKQATIDHVEPIENAIVEPQEEIIDFSSASDTFSLSIVSEPEIVAEPVFVQGPPPVAKPDLFLVYKNKSIIGVVEEGSAAHLSIEEHIASEMRQWIEEAKAPLDDRGLLILNVGKHARNYKSWGAYFVQNGLAPKQPKYFTKMDYWRSHMDSSASDEEVVARFAGRDFTYHAVPVHRMEDTV